MSGIAEKPPQGRPASGARAFARLDAANWAPRTVDVEAAAADAPDTAAPPEARAERLQPPAPQRVVAAETVTLGQIGDFLELDFRRVFTWLYAGRLLILVLAAVGAIAGGAFAMLSTPKYTVATDILIDPANLQVVRDDIFAAPGQGDGQLLNAGSKLRVLTSGNVLGRVVDRLDLAEDPEFVGSDEPSLFAGLFPSSSLNGPELSARTVALQTLRENVSSVADEKSFVATLHVTSEDANKSVTLADAIVTAFQDELASAEADSAARTAEALSDRLSTLKGDVKVAEEAVEAFKRDKGLSSSAGELVSTQAMTQLNQQVVTAEANVIAAQAAYDELVEGGSEANTAQTQSSATLSALRTSAGALQQQLDAQSRVYGPRHPTIVRLRTELQAVNAQVASEVGRVAASAKTALDEAKASLEALNKRADALKTDVFTDNDSLVTLRELEREAASKTAIYEAFLARAGQVTQREQIDTTNVRVISQAVPPSARSYPPRTVVCIVLGVAGGLALGLMLALGFGILADLRRPRTVVAVAA